MQQRRQAHGQSCLSVRLTQLSDDASRQMVGAEGVLEAGVRGAGINEKRVAELANVA
jgi:hypothetical protein